MSWRGVDRFLRWEAPMEALLLGVDRPGGLLPLDDDGVGPDAAAIGRLLAGRNDRPVSLAE